MKLVVFGLSHKTATLQTREQFAFNQDQIEKLIFLILQQTDASEVVVLCTCNRTEIYANLSSTNDLMNTLSEMTGCPVDELENSLYEYYERDALEHMMKVACGMDSLALGEVQILGQMKQTFQLSENLNAVGKLFRNLFQEIFQIGKKIQKTMTLGFCPASIALLFIELAKQKFSSFFNEASILLIGSGRTMQLCGRYLKQEGITKLHVASRHFDSAKLLANDLQAIAYDLTQLDEVLTRVDIVFAATASSVPTLKLEKLEKAIKRRHLAPLLLLDLGVPRDIDPKAQFLEGIDLYTIDHLQHLMAHHNDQQNHAIEKAHQMIKNQAKKCIQNLENQEVNLAIHVFREHANQMKTKELKKALAQLKKGTEATKVLEQLAHGLTNKILHKPSAGLREAGKQGDKEIVKRFYNLYCSN